MSEAIPGPFETEEDFINYDWKCGTCGEAVFPHGMSWDHVDDAHDPDEDSEEYLNDTHPTEPKEYELWRRKWAPTYEEQLRDAQAKLDALAALLDSPDGRSASELHQAMREVIKG